MKLNKIQRILRFKQSGWMRHILILTQKKDRYSVMKLIRIFNNFKLMNNSVYGKTMENLRQRIKIRVVKNSQDFIKYRSRPTCVNWKVFENNLAAIYEKKTSLTLLKPIYVGFTVIETVNKNVNIIAVIIKKQLVNKVDGG